MAGDWFPARVWMTKTHEVVVVADRVGLSPQAVAGHLLDLWSFATENTEDGYLAGVNVSALVRAIGADEALWRALADVSWIAFEGGGMRIVNWHNWLSESAKKRLKDRQRKKIQRKKSVRNLSAKCPRNVPKKVGQKRDNCVTTETDDRVQKTEEKREEKTRPAPVPIPPELDTPEFAAAWAAWLGYRVRIRKPLTDASLNIQLRKLAKEGPEWAVECIERTISRGWIGLRFPEDDLAPGRPRKPSGGKSLEEMFDELGGDPGASGAGVGG
jgi:hypothetical protein